MNKMEHFKKKLAENNLKVTTPRLVIYGSIANMKTHPTVDEVYNAIHNDYPSISLSTIYCTLETLAEYKIINKISNEQGLIRFDADTESHHHLYIENTQEIKDYYDEELDVILKEYFSKKKINNFNISEVKLEIKGNYNN